MNGPIALNQLPQKNIFRAGDVFVLFGELFGRGYANGLVNEARQAGMSIIGITVGRREADGTLRPLNDEELAAAEENLGGKIINVPLMAGFDMDAPAGTPTPTEMLGKLTLKSWTEDKLDWDHIAKCREIGVERFKTSLAQVMATLDGMIPDGRNVFFAHTMAGGIPKAKVFLAIANRVYYTADKKLAPDPAERMYRLAVGKLEYEKSLKGEDEEPEEIEAEPLKGKAKSKAEPKPEPKAEAEAERRGAQRVIDVVSKNSTRPKGIRSLPKAGAGPTRVSKKYLDELMETNPSAYERLVQRNPELERWHLG